MAKSKEELKQLSEVTEIIELKQSRSSKGDLYIGIIYRNGFGIQELRLYGNDLNHISYEKKKYKESLKDNKGN